MEVSKESKSFEQARTILVLVVPQIDCSLKLNARGGLGQYCFAGVFRSLNIQTSVTVDYAS